MRRALLLVCLSLAGPAAAAEPREEPLLIVRPDAFRTLVFTTDVDAMADEIVAAITH